MRLIRKNVERLTDDPVKAAKLKAEGFRELGHAPGKEMPGVEDKKPLEGMNATELKKLAKERKVEGYHSLSREELLGILKGVV